MRTLSSVAFAAAVSLALGACHKSEQQHLDVTVDWNESHQSIDGFGASSAFFGGTITDDQADQLFDAKKGIGLSLLRTMIGVPADTQTDGSESTDDPMPVATAPELSTAQQAMARGTKIWAAAWTPPPIWKTTNNKKGSDRDAGYSTNTLQEAHYQDFATYLADFVGMMKENGVELMGVSPVNEPDYTATWDNSQMDPPALTKFMRDYMGPTFRSRFPDVKTIAPETANFPSCQSYVDTLLGDSTAAGLTDIIATHPYPASGSTNLSYHAPQDHQKHFWETEWSQENAGGDTPDPSMTSAIDMAKHIHDHMVTTEMNAWNWWAIYITEDGLNDNTRLNPAFIQPDATKGPPYMFRRGYAFGNWSKFVRPGFHRIGATDHPTSGVLIEAYRDDTHLALIAVNSGSSKVTQRFKLEGTSIGSLTPWVTSNDDALVAKSAVDVGSDGFTYDLPGNSVTTFVSWDATSETPGLVLPMGGADAGMDAGATHNGLDCKNPVTPTNGGEGGVTDFTDWKASTGNWGNSNGLYGSIYAYHGPNGSSMNAVVDTANHALHVTGAVTMGDYGGAGLGFLDCANTQAYSQLQFTISGSSPGCDLELQIKTFEQTPTSQNPPGGCDQDAGTCYNYPVVKKVAVPSSQSMTVTTPFTSISPWSSDIAGQVVGLQWQFTGTNIPASDSDAGDSDGGSSDAAAGCPIDVSITGIKFLP